MEYVDDVVIMGARLKYVKEVFTSLVEWTNKMGFVVNEDKFYDSVTKAIQWKWICKNWYI